MPRQPAIFLPHGGGPCFWMDAPPPFGRQSWEKLRQYLAGIVASLPEPPESVPINALVPVPGTVLGDILKDVPSARIDDIEFVRTVAVARILMPNSVVRLSAGRESMSDATQALCFLAGASSIFTGDKLLTTGNAGNDKDALLFAKLGLNA